MGGISQARIQSAQFLKRLRGFDFADGFEHGYVLEGRGGGGNQAVAGSYLDSRSRMHGL